jgi:hypothetical protein
VSVWENALKQATKRRVFLSFDSDDLAQVRGLRLLAANPDYDLEFYDESLKVPIDSQNATYIKSQIRERISRASVTLCLVSETTHLSQWVDWELGESVRQNNALLAMCLKGCTSAILPRVLQERGTTLWAWSPESLSRLIREAK